MKILVLGAGRMGYGAVYDLVHNSPEVTEITVADADFAKAEAVAKKINSPKLSAIQLDVTNYERVRFGNARTRFGDLVRELLV